VPVDVKDVLYSSIHEIGREKIRMVIAADVKMSEAYCKDILERCTKKLGVADEEILMTLCEALLHFMLTASLLPSERKISVHGAELDIIIPSTKVLHKSPDKSLVIQVVRGDLEAKVRQAKSVQCNNGNIWLVSTRPLQTEYKNYHLGTEGLHYSHIISDISAFLSEKGDRGLKLLQGQ
jgi:hypothetical protein